jgi:hypothetical protein
MAFAGVEEVLKSGGAVGDGDLRVVEGVAEELASRPTSGRSTGCWRTSTPWPDHASAIRGAVTLLGA